MDVLNGLTEEIGERRYRGRRFYLRMLGCRFFMPLQVRRPSTSVTQMETDCETERDEGGSASRTVVHVGRIQVASVCRARDCGEISHPE